MWLIIGLGNPGDRYKHNRHNIGFMAIDQIARDYSFPPFRKKHQAEITEGRIGNQKLILVKPITYMNNSGQAARAISSFYKIDTKRTVCIHDELDLPPGTVKVKDRGGAAGHNGIKSMIAHLGSQDFWRIRMGIGHPGDKNRVSDYVLSDFAKSEQIWLAPLLDATSRHIGLILDGNAVDFAAKVAQDAPSPSDAKEKRS